MRKHLVAGALAAAVAGSGALALSTGVAQAAPVASHQAAATTYTFTTLNDQADPTFNQLLGINVHNVIAGYFGSGAAGHPNKGYLLSPPYAQGNYVNENFPGSAQTQVTGIDDKGNTSGFWVTAGGTSHGFVEWNGVFASYNDPLTPKVKGAVNQLLGINNAGTAVGFYNDRNGNSHATSSTRPPAPSPRSTCPACPPWPPGSTTPGTWSGSPPTPRAPPRRG